MRIKYLIMQLIPRRVKDTIKIRRTLNHRYELTTWTGVNLGTLIEESMDAFLAIDERNDKPLRSEITRDIIECYVKYGANPKEYFFYNLRHKEKTHRETFLTDFIRDISLIDASGIDKFKELQEKYHFYELNKEYFHRNVFRICKNSVRDKFIEFAVSNRDLFVKPMSQSCGRGIFFTTIHDTNDAESLFDELNAHEGDWMIEQKIIQSKETAVWNESSVNTVRLPSILTKKGHYIMTPFFRTGRKGTVIDNAGSGGVFANVDRQSGMIYSDGMDEYGHFYECHPDSGMKYKGWQIPRWNELLQIVEEIHRKNMPSHIYIGFDFALTDNGWVLVEGNWGQFVNQYIDKVGNKKEFMQYIKQGALQ